MEPPAIVYQRLLAENQAQLVHEQGQDTGLGYAKIVVFLVEAIVASILLLRPPAHFGLLLIPVLIFVPLAIAHERVLQSLRNRKRVIEFYERGLARLEDRWAGTGNTGDRFLEENHPYARDLDLFGKGSLFELLCTARTRAGEQTLAQWLLHAAPPEEVRLRQTAIMELKDRLPLREKLFVTGESVRLGVLPEALTAWAEQERIYPFQWLAPALAALAVLWIAAAIYAFTANAWLPLLLMSIVNMSISVVLWRRAAEPVEAAEKAAEGVRVLAEILGVIERERFESPRLQSLRASLDTGYIAPSEAMKKLVRIIRWQENRRNPIVAQLSLFLFYVPQLALASERWRQTFGPAIRGWLSAVGEFEALSALSGYASEHPADVLPDFIEERACFEAVGLAHPLLPATTAVGNDLTLGSKMQLIVISGPNMAGKSTFLRGVGINAVLAQCGAPVRARSLRLSPLAVGASICILDSVQDGVSRFYAEIKRLKLLSDLAQGPAALLFLLDELLSGTNSHDRFDGTRFVLHALMRREAIGMVTTHDLALTAIPETIGESAQNYHFEDSVENGALSFDYRLHPGVVRTSNALKLMKSIGLELDN